MANTENLRQILKTLGRCNIHNDGESNLISHQCNQGMNSNKCAKTREKITLVQSNRIISLFLTLSIDS